MLVELAGAALANAAPSGNGGLLDPLLQWLRIDEPWRVWLVLFGLAGQAIFCARWIVQWLASEARGESHVPELFWWASLLGATMLLTYFVIDRDPVGIVGQLVGWAVYARNLVLIRRTGRPSPTS